MHKLSMLVCMHTTVYCIRIYCILEEVNPLARAPRTQDPTSEHRTRFSRYCMHSENVTSDQIHRFPLPPDPFTPSYFILFELHSLDLILVFNSMFTCMLYVCHTYIHVHTYTYMHVHTYIHAYIRTYRTYVYVVHACIIRIYVCMYVKGCGKNR